MKRVVFFVLYLTVGAFLAVPYSYLAGWDIDILPSLVLGLPLYSMVLWGLVFGSGFLRLGRNQAGERCLWAGKTDKRTAFFAGPLLFFLLLGILPIASYQAARLFQEIGWEAVGGALEAIRYQTPILFVLVGITLAVGAALGQLVFRNRQRGPRLLA